MRALVVAGILLAAVGGAAARGAGDPATELAQKYAPVVKIVEQQRPCGHGEPYLPSNVDTSASFDFVNLLSALIHVVTLPFVAVVTTYLYFDLVVRERLAPEQAPRVEVLPAEL